MTSNDVKVINDIDKNKIITASPPNFSNIVLVTNHNSEINLNVLYNILPIVTISPAEIKRKWYRL